MGVAPDALAATPTMTLATLIDTVHERNERLAWSQTDELLAEVIELLSVMRIEHLAVNGVKHSKLPDIIHIPRPGERAASGASSVVVMSPTEYVQAMAA